MKTCTIYLGVNQNNTAHLIEKVKALSHKDDGKLDKILIALNIDQSEFPKIQQPYLTFTELEKIKNQGHFLGGHTVHHYPMDQQKVGEQIDEILDSIIWLKNNFDLKYELFSFPFSDSFASSALFDKVFSAMPNTKLQLRMSFF